jgi:hypothetical protein
VSRRAGNVRRFVEKDIPLVAQLHRTVWDGGGAGSADLSPYHDYFADVFLDNPSGDPALPSWVYEQHDGRIVGFLGIVPRRMVMNGARFQAAVSSQFIVDPASCVPIVAVSLATTFLQGPQDLSIADEANDVSRKVWEGLGGTTLLLRSLYWTRPLRPVQLGVSTLRERRSLRLVAAPVRPLGAILDAVATRMSGSYFYQSPPRASAEDLRSDAVLTHRAEFSGVGSLHVDYDHGTLEWLLERVSQRKPGGRVLKALLRYEDRLIGWYVGHLGRDGLLDVLEIVAKPASIDDVLDHLFYNAWRLGAVAVRGRMEPRFMQALSDKYCVFHRRGPWMLINARNPDLLQPFHTGNACFSRLDGEWALGLR